MIERVSAMEQRAYVDGQPGDKAAGTPCAEEEWETIDIRTSPGERGQQWGAEIDTTRRIQHDFSLRWRSESLEYFQRPDVRQRRFNETLKHWVELEYDQYEHYSDDHMSRSKLGDVLTALKDRLRPSARRARTAENAQETPDRYTRFNLMRAVGALLMIDDSVPSGDSLLTGDIIV
jgi:hypothetical protein